MAEQPMLTVRDLRTHVVTEAGAEHAVVAVSFSIEAGEILGILGESGSGTNIIARSILRLLEPPVRIVGGEITLRGVDVLALKPAALRAMRGRDVAMIGRNPMTSLNPLRRIGDQVAEAMRVHGAPPADAVRHAMSLLDQVRMTAPERAMRAYPHQMSLGERQRVMLAIAMSNNPGLLLADEPTGALDVADQVQFLDLLREVNRMSGTAILLISGDPGVIRGLCTRTLVMYAGEIVEAGPTDAVLADPRHPYTSALVEAAAYLRTGRRKLNAIAGAAPNLLHVPSGCRFAERCSARQAVCDRHPDLVEVATRRWSRCFVAASGGAFPACVPADIAPYRPPRGARALIEVRRLMKQFARSGGLLVPQGRVPALQGVDLAIQRGETLGIVGESGAGKSTLGRLLLRLLRPDAGQILFDGTDITRLRQVKLRPVRRRMQCLPQNPGASLNPRMTIADILAEPLRAHQIETSEAGTAPLVLEMLNLVGLPRSARSRHPNQCSAGEQQRVAIARALMLRPELVVVDDPLSALDLTDRAQIINLMIDLRQHFGLTYLIMARDPAPVRLIADRILLLHRGQVTEIAGAPYFRPVTSMHPRRPEE